MSPLFKLVFLSFLATLLLFYLQLKTVSLQFSNAEKNLAADSSQYCTCKNIPEDKVGISVLDVSPFNLVCVDSRAPVLLYPLAIPNLRQFVLKEM